MARWIAALALAAGCGADAPIDDGYEDESCVFGNDQRRYVVNDLRLGGRLGALADALDEATSGRVELRRFTDELVLRGTAPILAHLRSELEGCGDSARLTTFLGHVVSPDPCLAPADVSTCGQHLAGTGCLETDRNSPIASAGGSLRVGRLLAPLRDYRNDVVAAFAAGPSLAIPVVIDWAHVEVATVTDGFLDGGRVQGVVEVDRETHVLAPELSNAITAAIAGDCGATCACSPGSAGAGYQDLLDIDGDCVVTQDELTGHPLFDAGLRPDVDTDDDGVADGWSVELEFSAVRAFFDAPL